MHSRRVYSPAKPQNILERFRGGNSFRKSVGGNRGSLRRDFGTHRGVSRRAMGHTESGDQILDCLGFGQDAFVQTHAKRFFSSAQQQFDAFEAAKPQFPVQMRGRPDRAQRRLPSKLGDKCAHHFEQAFLVQSCIELSYRRRQGQLSKLPRADRQRLGICAQG